MRRRGSTLAEVLFTLALVATVVGAATLLYASAVAGTMDAAAAVETGAGTDAIAREVDLYLRNALDAQVVTVAGRPALKLTMGGTRDARDGRGMVTGYSASYTHPRLGPAYEPGETVWIYAGGVPTGSGPPPITTVGDVPYLARRGDGLQPTGADVDQGWTFLDAAMKVRRTPGSFDFAFSRAANDSKVAWTVTAIAGTGENARVYDAARASSFRRVAVAGTTNLRWAAP